MALGWARGCRPRILCFVVAHPPQPPPSGTPIAGKRIMIDVRSSWTGPPTRLSMWPWYLWWRRRIRLSQIRTGSYKCSVPLSTGTSRASSFRYRHRRCLPFPFIRCDCGVQNRRQMARGFQSKYRMLHCADFGFGIRNGENNPV
jgi:hypothetical protein